MFTFFEERELPLASDNQIARLECQSIGDNLSRATRHFYVVSVDMLEGNFQQRTRSSKRGILVLLLVLSDPPVGRTSKGGMAWKRLNLLAYKIQDRPVRGDTYKPSTL